jgi:hypothetical protein
MIDRKHAVFCPGQQRRRHFERPLRYCGRRLRPRKTIAPNCRAPAGNR